MQKLLLILLLLVSAANAHARINKPIITGFYAQWGYSRAIYSKSDIHFTNGSKYDFTIHKAVARDAPDFKAFYTNPVDITIPQNVCRIGLYLNKAHTHAIELNFDHAKYVVTDSQKVRVSGQIGGETFDRDTVLHPWFAHVEHTDGANFLLLNYVGQQELLHDSKKDFTRATMIYKLGGGIVIPRSDILLLGQRLDNKYHIAGYIFGGEAGFRIYPFRSFFLEATAKGGYANYLNTLSVGDGGRIKHHFWFGEIIGTLGIDINLPKYGYKARMRQKATQ